MTRIIAGTARGRRLKTPSGSATRPTTDRVKEALFSALESQFGTMLGLRFLDLYAGSGAVGLEAISRGATAVLVEKDRATAELIRKNAVTAGLTAYAVTSTVSGHLAISPAEPFDVVFLDPPYDLPNPELKAVLALLLEHLWVAPDGLVMIERSARSGRLHLPPGMVLERTRDYGETVLHQVELGTED